MNLTKEELQQQLKAIQTEEDNKIIKEALPYFESFKGKCFKSKDYYSGEKSWWRYIKVLDVNESCIYVSGGRALSNYKGVYFQTDSYGTTTINQEEDGYIHTIEDYTEITKEDFNKEVGKMISNVSNILYL